MVLVKRRNFPENLIGPEKGFALEELGGEEGESGAESRGEAPIPPDEELPEASSGLVNGSVSLTGPASDEIGGFTPGVADSPEFNSRPKLPALRADRPDSFCIGVS